MKENPYYPRRSGRTTRIADKIIQDLFEVEGEDKWIPVTDHHNTKKMSKYLFRIIRQRLSTEHSHVMIDIHEENGWIYIRLK